MTAIIHTGVISQLTQSVHESITMNYRHDSYMRTTPLKNVRESTRNCISYAMS